MSHPRDAEEVTPILKGEEAGAPRCATTGDLKRNCQCRPCIGRRNRRKGVKKQRDVRKTMERQTGTIAGTTGAITGHEEQWRLSARVEVKAGRKANGTATVYRDARAQSDAAGAHGDGRPFVLALVPDGWPAGRFLYVVASDDALAFAQALIDGYGGLA